MAWGQGASWLSVRSAPGDLAFPVMLEPKFLTTSPAKRERAWRQGTQGESPGRLLPVTHRFGPFLLQMQFKPLGTRSLPDRPGSKERNLPCCVLMEEWRGQKGIWSRANLQALRLQQPGFPLR